jgi:hypothetical protein
MLTPGVWMIPASTAAEPALPIPVVSPGFLAAFARAASTT